MIDHSAIANAQPPMDLARRQFATRVQGRAEAPGDFWMICRSAPATDHRAIGHGASLQTVHYCDNCSAGGQAGWFGVSTK